MVAISYPLSGKVPGRSERADGAVRNTGRKAFDCRESRPYNPQSGNIAEKAGLLAPLNDYPDSESNERKASKVFGSSTAYCNSSNITT